MATHSSVLVLAWRIPGTGEPGWLPSMGSHRVGHDWSDLALAWKHFYVSFSFQKVLRITYFISGVTYADKGTAQCIFTKCTHGCTYRPLRPPQASSFCSITTCQTNNCSSQRNFASLLNVMFVWLNHVIMYTGTFFIFTAPYYSIVWICHDLWWWTFCLQWFGAITNSNAIIILCMSLGDYIHIEF